MSKPSQPKAGPKTPPFPKYDETDGAEANPVDQFRMPLMAHLHELRKRLIVVLSTGFAACLGAYAFVDHIWAFLVAPMNKALYTTGMGTMAMTDPLEGFMTELKVAGLAGLLIVSPILFYQIWRFVAPGLYPKEKRFVIPLGAASTILFLGGAAFGYFVIFDVAFPFFLEIAPEDTQAVLSINSYLTMATKMLLAFGLCFQLPVIVFFLARVGLIDHKDMVGGFKYSVVGMFVVSAIITPPDVISQLLMAGPLIVLYAVGIIIAWVFTTKKREAAA